MGNRTYVRLDKGVVQEVIRVPDVHADFAIHELFHADVVTTLLDVTRHDPQPQEGWVTRDHGRSFQPPSL